jgi:hypothetical protein
VHFYIERNYTNTCVVKFTFREQDWEGGGKNGIITFIYTVGVCVYTRKFGEWTNLIKRKRKNY